MRMMAKIVARKDVADVDLDHRHRDRRNGVADRDRGVRVAAGIEHHAGGFLGAGLVDPVDQLALMVRLPEFERERVALCRLATQALEVGQRRAPIGLRLAGAEQIEIRAVEDVDGLRHGPPARWVSRFIGTSRAKGKPRHRTDRQQRQQVALPQRALLILS